MSKVAVECGEIGWKTGSVDMNRTRSLIIGGVVLIGLAAGGVLVLNWNGEDDSLPTSESATYNTESTDAPASTNGPVEIDGPPATDTTTLTPTDTPTAMPTSYPMRLEQVGQFSGGAEALALNGNTLYMKTGSRVATVDVSNPNTPTIIGQSEPLPSLITAFSSTDHYALVGDVKGELWVLDMSMPGNPQIAGSIDMGDYVAGITVSGRYVYVACWKQGLKIVDITDPTHPKITSTLDTGGSAQSIALAGHLVLVGTVDINIVDVSDPTHPTVVSIIRKEGAGHGLAVSGQTLYAGSDVYDISDPSTPRIVASDIAYDDGTVAEGPFVFSYSNRWSVHTPYNVLEIYDFSDIQKPVRASKPINTLPADKVVERGNIVVKGHLLYLGTMQGLEIYDLSVTPTRRVIYADVEGAEYYIWKRIAFLRTEYAEIYAGCCAAFYPGEIDVVGGYLYTFTPDNVFAWSLQDPTKPALVRSIERSWSLATSFQTSKGFIRSTHDGYEFIDTQDPANPRLTQVKYGGLVGYLMAIFQDRLFLQSVKKSDTSTLEQTYELHIFDISNPYAPRLLSSYAPISGNSRNDYIIVGNYVYINSESIVLDISDPSEPRRVDVPPLNWPSRFSNEDAIFALGDLQLDIYLKSDPHTCVSSLDVPPSWDMRFANDKLFLIGASEAEHKAYTIVIDVQDPSQPLILTSLDMQVEQVAIYGEYMYVVHDWNIIDIYRLLTN